MEASETIERHPPNWKKMVTQGPGFQTRAFPRSRGLVVDAGEWNRRKHIINLLAEFDVTRARQRVRERAACTGEKLSFTAFIAACVGGTVAVDRIWHAYRKGRRLILFDDVDIGTLVEHDVEGAKLATFHVIRRANDRSVCEIHEESGGRRPRSSSARGRDGAFLLPAAPWP